MLIHTRNNGSSTGYLFIGGDQDGRCWLVANVTRFCGCLCDLTKVPNIYQSHDERFALMRENSRDLIIPGSEANRQKKPEAVASSEV